jgi:hypothetical protein
MQSLTPQPLGGGEVHKRIGQTCYEKEYMAPCRLKSCNVSVDLTVTCSLRADLPPEGVVSSLEVLAISCLRELYGL